MKDVEDKTRNPEVPSQEVKKPKPASSKTPSPTQKKSQQTGATPKKQGKTLKLSPIALKPQSKGKKLPNEKKPKKDKKASSLPPR